MYKSFYLIKHLDTNIGNTIDIKRLTIFIFCYLFILTINYISGGSGFGNLALYYMIGMLSGLMVRQRHKLVLSR
jgi:preprotein translocase subunit SecF